MKLFHISNFHTDSMLLFQHESIRTCQRDEHGIQGMGCDRSAAVIDNPRKVKVLIKNLAKDDSGKAEGFRIAQ